MHPNDLIAFRDNVAIPRMLELFERTQVPEGARYIDHLEVSFLDGRNCGHESYIRASGLQYRNGRAEEYLYEECDIGTKDFFDAHKDCVFISDGVLHVVDELAELDLRTPIRNAGACDSIFHEFESPENFRSELTCIEFEKLKHMMQIQGREEAASRRPSIDDRISGAAGRVSGSRTDIETTSREQQEPVF